MSLLFLAAALQFVVLHSVDGHAVLVNPAEVSSMMSPRSGRERVSNPHVRCVVFMTNGRHHSVLETCEQIQQKLDAR